MESTDTAGGHLSCSVCFTPFDGQQRRPWDIGCGHSYCEYCLRQHPRSFRYCPECRSRASQPHVNIALLRLVNAQQPAGQQQQLWGQQQQQQQQLRALLTRPGSSSIDTATAAAAAATDSPPSSLVPHQPPYLRAASHGRITSSSASLAQTLRPTDLQGALAAQQAKIAEWRTRMWCYITPVLGFLYLISPLDFIPDFLPLIGWLDDFLVIIYIACSIVSVVGQQQEQQQQRNTMQL